MKKCIFCGEELWGRGSSQITDACANCVESGSNQALKKNDPIKKLSGTSNPENNLVEE